MGVLTRSVLVATAAVILLFGLYPSPMAQWSQSASFADVYSPGAQFMSSADRTP